MRYFIHFLGLSCALLQAQTTVYLRSSGPQGYVITGASNTTPIVIQTQSPHGLAVGDMVANYGVCAVNPNANNISTADGFRKVKAVIDSTHFSITDTNGVDVAGNGVWCDGSYTTADGFHFGSGGVQAGGKVNPFTLVDGPRGWLDGTNGTYTRKLSLGTQNGLMNVSVAINHTATVTTSYAHGVSTGDKVSIWNTTSSVLNNNNNSQSGTPYTVTGVTTNTFTVTAPASVAAGDYTHNDHCGNDGNGSIGGTDNCVRISQLAYRGNPFWDRIMNLDIPVYMAPPTGFKHPYDGGTFYMDSTTTEKYAEVSLQFFVDQANVNALNTAKYCLNRVERIDGVTWSTNEEVPGGGTNELGDFGSTVLHGLGACYIAAAPYLSAVEKKAFLDKIYNDIDDLSAPCNKTNVSPTRKVLATGTARGGTSSTITLDPSDAQASGYYVNNVVQLLQPNVGYYRGLIVDYDSATKIARISGTWGGSYTPGAGVKYSIYATMSISSSTAGATATVTGYNTSFRTDVSPGDAITGINSWVMTNTAFEESYVKSVESDTSLTVLNNLRPTATGTPTVAWVSKQWRTGDCGFKFLQKHWTYPGAQPMSYPNDGGDQTLIGGNPAYGSNNEYTWAAGHFALDLATADDEPRAVWDLAQVQTQTFDYLFRFVWNAWTGLTQSGSNYGLAKTGTHGMDAMWLLQNAVPDYPSMDTSGPAIRGYSLLKTYLLLPDHRWDGSRNQPWIQPFGARSSEDIIGLSNSISTSSYLLDHGMAFSPGSAESKYLRGWLAVNGTTADLIADAFPLQYYIAQLLVKIDPRQPRADYTVQPFQRLFAVSSRSTCLALTGASCPATFRKDAFISHTGWSPLHVTSNLTGTHLLYQSGGFWADHDAVLGGAIRLYKVGPLLTSDNVPQGAIEENQDQAALDNPIVFAEQGGNTLFNGGNSNNVAASALIARWASGNHGAWETAYGDRNSNYVYALSDLTGEYRTSYSRVWRHIAHFKKAGTQEILMQFDDVTAGVAVSGGIRTQVHYAQNKELTTAGADYDEGDTTCPGGGTNCTSLNSSRLVFSEENGASDIHNPTRQYALVTRYLSPGTITVRWDGDQFPGAGHHTKRVSVCAGASCGSTASGLEALIVHRITTLSDETLVTTALNPNSSWTGVQTADKVALFSRGGQLRTSVQFTTTHNGTAQYLIAGMAAGSYNVTVGGAPVLTAAPVSDGDNTLYFEYAAGAVSVQPTAAVTACSIFTSGVPPGIMGVAYSQAMQTANCTGAVSWQVSAGSLCSGLSLDGAAGIIKGTPAVSQSCNFTLRATDSMSQTATQGFSIAIASAPGAALSGQVACSGCVLR